MEYRKTQSDQYGGDMVFVSLHGMCAIDHQHINGMDYTEKMEEVSSSLKRQVGQRNCHSLSYGIKGISENPYSDKEREDAQRTQINKSNIHHYRKTKTVNILKRK